MRNLSCAVTAIAVVACSGLALAADNGALSLRKPVLPASYQESSRTVVKTQMSEVTESEYMEVSSFFNVRESNANVIEGEWEFEAATEWQTGEGVEGDDDFYFTPSIKYGFTDTTYLEFEFLPIRLGDGGDHGAGETEITWFNQVWEESDSGPGGAYWLSARLPTGDGSSKVDASLHGALTKTFADNWRGHLNGDVETANGGIGSVNEEHDRRHFQWGLGVGVDYAFSEETLGLINYTNESSDEYGHRNLQVVEVGLAHQIADGQHIKAAVDYGIDNQESAEWGAKLQWSIDWK